MRNPKLLKESMMSEVDMIAQESDDVKTFISKLKTFLKHNAADPQAYNDPKVLKGIVSMYFDNKGNKVTVEESVSKLTEMIRAEIKNVLKEAVPTLRKLKVGTIVIPKTGPHKGQKHTIIHDFGNGKYNIKPVGLKGSQIKYQLGAAGATEDQFDVVQESIKKVGNKYAVYPKKGGKRLGTHSTKKKAQKQLAAIEISKHKK